MRTRTSVSHPLRIDIVSISNGGGQIGMTLCPGRCDHLSVEGPWERDLGADFDVIAAWKPDLMLTLVETSEFSLLGVPEFAKVAAKRVSKWRHLPIADACVPDRTFEDAWYTVGADARATLLDGDRILLHCRAGLGRTGMIAARLLVELGATAEDAIAAVRRARPNTIETRSQEQHVRSQSPIAEESLTDQTFKDRVHGAVLGAAIGDALGSAFEFLSSAEIKECIGGPVVREYFPAQPGSLMFPRGPGIPTDDTAMTLALIDALIQPRAPSARSIFDSFGETLRHQTGRFADMFWKGGPGGACVAMLRAFDTGAAPFEQLDPKAGGNGAAMRAHPCGAFSDRAFVADIAAQQARLSHPHPSAIAAAQVVALVVHEGIYTGRLMAKLPPEITDPHMVRAWNTAHENLVRGIGLPTHLRDADMAGWNTVATAHAIAQLYADDIETGIGIAAGSGRDTDTVASIVGAMLGAVHGRGALPSRWIDGLQNRTVIETAADELCRSVPLLDRAHTAPASLALRESMKTRECGRTSTPISLLTPGGSQSPRGGHTASQTSSEKVVLSSAFLRALMDAEFYHHEQKRKSTNIPYFSHLLGVCSLVLEAGGSETEAIAALLHDAAEDAGGAPVLAAIEQNFGTVVATIVGQLSDGLPVKGARKGAWLERKTEYLSHLRDADASTLLISAADKLHNLRAIQSDYREIGNAVFERFSAPDDKRTNTLWYYRSLLEAFTNRAHGVVDPRLARLTRPLGEILDWFDEQEPVSRRGAG